MSKNRTDPLSLFPDDLLSNEEMLGLVLEQVSDLVFIMRVKDETFFYTYMNGAAERYHNVTREEMEGKSIRKLVGRIAAADIEEKYRHVVHYKEAYTYEDVVLHKGDYFYGETVLTPLFDEAGTVTHVLAITKDETEVVVKEEDLLDVSATYRSLLRNTPDAVLITSTDGEIIEVNGAFEELYGYTVEELSSDNYKFVPEGRKAETLHLLKEAAAGNTISGFETVRCHKEGREIDVSITMAPVLNRREEISAVSFMVRDISERVEAAKRIHQSEEKFQVIADHSHDLITVFNEKARVIYSSPSHMEWLGYNVEGWTAEEVTSYIHPDDRDMALRTFLRSRQFEDSFQFRIRLLMQSGLWRWFECRGYPVPSGKFKAHFVLISRDVTSEVDYVEKLKEYAYYDHLTELPNRRLFEDSIVQAMDHADSVDGSFAILYMDGDGFKEVNDLYGHEVGDKFLKQIGVRLKRVIRDRDSVGRLGGDEFAVMVKNLSTEEAAMNVAARIQKHMGVPYDIEGHRIISSFSIGVSFYPSQARTVSELLRKADEALYRSKQQGIGLVAFAEPEESF
ncbi:sensor domain-containing protein [Salimicrobium halophilum]|uniref:PAS domain S-box-containing protein/diguanylate cyclase (GGDEF) domain-containing protein n=1 Tax=Salimicrobium halophilum TaxID=86666 RepID=A0A1G8V6D8_9BACI|nr:diguanylate cyclase [Salimicrobium halophilum]SDJ60885.1 PAS domain S-box-containing protein/diguanylate cyclase (GGDEF) domain-containing protein [Salimicrobium halophilum]